MRDLISRQAAIDALEKWEARYSWDYWCCTHKDEAEKYHIFAPSKVIEDLPPARRENPNFCATCRFRGEECVYCPIKEQPEIVYCKDCVYHAGWGYCEEVDGLWYDNDYCCRGEKGERREE